MTTVGLVKAALVTLWAAAFDPNVTQVRYGNRVTFAGEERISVGKSVPGTSRSARLGPAREMEEDYEVICMISVTRNGTVDDQQAVTERVLALFATAETAVRASPNQTLGVAGVILANVEGDWSLDEAEASETGGPINTSYEFRVHVRARYRLP